MSLVVAKIIGSNVCIVSDTKLSPSGYEEIRLKQRPEDGVIKTIILNKNQCVSFAGNEYFAEAAFQEMEQGGVIEDMQEILFRYHTLSDNQTEFIFCFGKEGAHIIIFKDGEISHSTSAWIGDREAFGYYQEYYHADVQPTPTDNNNITTDGKEPWVKNIRMTINSKVPNDEFSKMSSSMDHVIYNHNVASVGGFRIQVVYDDNHFSYTRYTNISNEVIDIIPGKPGRFGWSNASKGSYYVNCAKGGNNYLFAAIHVLEANLGVLYIRRRNGLMKPELYHLDLLDFSDFISQYDLHIPILDEHRPPKYYNRAKSLFETGQYFEAIHWLCWAIRFAPRDESAPIYYVLGLCFHNYGRPLTAQLCFEYAIELDPKFEEMLVKQK